ncbi:TPA: PTS sugar transporter subunit IIB [Listeria monocytogenes]
MRIMLACNAGMSTSLVVSKMQEAAKNQGKDYKIWAVEQGEIQGELGNFDVLLLGPQIRHIQKRIIKLVGDQAKVAVIDSIAYGTCNGEKVLEQSELLLKGV